MLRSCGAQLTGAGFEGGFVCSHRHARPRRTLELIDMTSEMEERNQTHSSRRAAHK